MKILRSIKACHACHNSYNIGQWRTLTLCGPTGDDPVPEGCERRFCFCGERLTLDLRGVETIADALPDEHPASRANPPPTALADDDPHACPRSWAYRTEAFTAIAVYVHAPLVPYPKPNRTSELPPIQHHAILRDLLAARMVLDALIGQVAPGAAAREAPANGSDPKDAQP